MIYLSYISNTYVTHNKLEEKVLKLLIAHNRLVIHPFDVEAFTQKLQIDIEVFNAEHPKCRPIRIKFEQRPFTGDQPIKDFHVCWNCSGAETNGRTLCEFKLLASA